MKSSSSTRRVAQTLPPRLSRLGPMGLCLSLCLGALGNAAAGSLYQGDVAWRGLTSDRRAYRAGDVLTVQIVENSSAQSAANTTTSKSGSINLAWQSTTSQRDANLSLSDAFAGKGQIQRSGRLTAQITVTVREVDPQSGLLTVAGEQQILVNNEKQDIRLEGRVRPIDIADNNTVLSTRLADARISYLGDGILGEKQRPGLLTRLLSLLGIL